MKSLCFFIAFLLFFQPHQVHGKTCDHGSEQSTRSFWKERGAIGLSHLPKNGASNVHRHIRHVVTRQMSGSNLSPRINEIHYDNAGADRDEAVEIRAEAGADVSGWKLSLYNGKTRGVYRTARISGRASNVVDGVGFVVVRFRSGGLQNGPRDGIALVDPMGKVVQFLCYEGTMTALQGPATGQTCTDAGVAETASTPVGQSLQATGCGSSEVWALDSSSFGSANTGQSFLCDAGSRNTRTAPTRDALVKPVFEIQGTGLSSPFAGRVVTTSGVVTAVASNGFYLQDTAGDDNERTSDGIYVFTRGTDDLSAAVRDAVEVSGKVTEYVPGRRGSRNQGTTQVTAEAVRVLSSGNELPTPVTIGRGGRLPLTSGIESGLRFWETLEGMRVRVARPRLVAPTSRFGEYFTVVDGGRGATGLSKRGAIVLTRTDFNPEIVEIGRKADVFDYKPQSLRPGAQLSDVVGVVSYSFGRYEVIPTASVRATDARLAPERTMLSGSPRALTIASFNLKNFAQSKESVTKRAASLANVVMRNLNAPDIIALQEVLDDSAEKPGTIRATRTLQRLVDAIVDAGGPRYKSQDNPYIADGKNGGIPGGNIRVAYLYNPDRVKLTKIAPVVDPQEQQAGRTAFAGSRPPLAATFEFAKKSVLVVNVHFSSKGGSAPTFGTEQPVESRQDDPTVNGSVDERLAQARAVKRFIDASAVPNKVVLGDMNDFAFSAPVNAMAPLRNLADLVPERERYTFFFGGNAQMLDHILVSPNLRRTARFDIVHAVTEFPGSDSDHEPIVAQLTPSGP